MPATAPRPRKPRKGATDDKVIFVSDISHWFLKNLRLTGPFTASLCFQDGLIAELDFEKWVSTGKRGPMIRPLADEHYFKQVFLDHGALTWPNGFDIDPCAVRHWAEQGFCD